MNFDQPAVEGNDGNQNQTGLSVNAAEPPPGNTGSLHWVDLASGPGAAVTWCNGTVWSGNTYNERPADMSSYGKVVVRMAATNLTEGAVTTVGVQYFLQTGGFEFHVAGPLVQLPADGEFHDLEFPIASIPWLEFVQAHGINLQQHGGGDLAIDVDHVLAVATEFRDCNGNRIPDEREILEGRSADCNSSGLPDECDIDRGTSADCDLNGVPDECDTALEPSSRVLYTWEGVGDPRGWRRQFGENEVIPANDLEGELRALENGLTPGTGWALSDAFDIIAEGAPSVGGLDLLGMTALELDLGHNGAEPVAVQFYVQATPDFLYLALGPDQPIAPGMATYTAPLSGLNPLQATYVRTIGINIRPHLALGNLDWTLNEVRVLGTPLAQRSLALHDADSPDGGLQGAVAGPERAAVEGNDGSPNQTGLSHNPGPDPPGNSGSLRWTDLASLGGGSVVWFNGTAFRGSTFNERPVDLGSYHRLTVRLAATSVDPGAVEAVEVQYFLQTANFQTYPAGPPQSLPADGQFHELSFPIGDVPDRAYTDAHGLDLGEHDGGSLVIDVDWIRVVSETPVPGDCNGNRSPDRCDIALGLLPDADRDGIPDPCQAASFRRGDTTSDGLVDISDPIFTFAMLFLGGNPTPCRDTADANDDGQVDVSDGIYTLNSLFLGGPALPEPGTGRCGRDPSDDPMVDCDYPAEHCPP